MTNAAVQTPPGGGTSGQWRGRPEDAGLTPSQLAAKYGLAVSGARPPITEYVRQLWSRRHFILAYSRARLTAQYTNASLGQLWQVLTPLLNVFVYLLIFGILLKQSRGMQNYISFLVVGFFIWQFTQSAVMTGTRSIADQLGLIRALHFPRACLPVAFTLIQLRQLIVSLGVMLVIVLISGEPLAWTWFLVVPVLLLQSLFNAGLALAMARVGAKVTDMAQLMPFLMRTWMYASGVFYSITLVGQHVPDWAKTLLQVNPAAVFIDLVRYAVLEERGPGGVVLPPHAWALAVGWAVVVFGLGFVYFWKAEELYGRG